MEQYDPRVDAYIDKAAPFAKPILEHLRKLVHQTSPLITEAIKWGFPFFDYKGPVCQMVSFKEHCGFGFWKASMLHDPNKLLNTGEPAAGSFGRITKLADLPSDDILKEFILQAIHINEQGIKPAVKKAPAEKKELIMPDDFSVILNGNAQAKAVFENFSYSHKKEYLEWITEAKTEATREKRMQSAIEMMAEGKSKNWKYK